MLKDTKFAAWSMRYRPQVLADCILSPNTRALFDGIVASKEIPNLMLSGPAGIGKTTVGKCLANELNAEVLFLNGSGEDRGIAAVSKLKAFASAMTLDGASKIVFYDEADNLSSDAQMALRATIESVGKSCSFVLTCNFPGRLIEPLHSRCTNVSLELIGDERKKAKQDMARRVAAILKEENVQFDSQAIVAIINAGFPDFRDILNLVQRFGVAGPINADVARRIALKLPEAIFEFMMKKDIRGLIDWVYENVNDPSAFVAGLFPMLSKRVSDETLAYSIVFLNDCQAEIPIVADKHLSVIAALSKISVECQIKEANV